MTCKSILYFLEIGPALIVLGLLTGCASHSASITANYVSPVIYNSWSCSNLIDEKMRLESKVHQIAYLQDENADADAVMMGVGAILLWPVLLGLAATEDRSEELANLKGKYDAVSSTLIQKDCYKTGVESISQSLESGDTQEEKMSPNQLRAALEDAGKLHEEGLINDEEHLDLREQILQQYAAE